jgi:hypothetical protein
MALRSKVLALGRVPWMISPSLQDLAKTERRLQPQHVTMIMNVSAKRRKRNQAIVAVATMSPPPAPSARKTTTANLIGKRRAARKINPLLPQPLQKKILMS